LSCSCIHGDEPKPKSVVSTCVQTVHLKFSISISISDFFFLVSFCTQEKAVRETGVMMLLLLPLFRARVAKVRFGAVVVLQPEIAVLCCTLGLAHVCVGLYYKMAGSYLEYSETDSPLFRCVLV
jgi:hypothetical protein